MALWLLLSSPAGRKRRVRMAGAERRLLGKGRTHPNTNTNADPATAAASGAGVALVKRRRRRWAGAARPSPSCTLTSVGEGGRKATRGGGDRARATVPRGPAARLALPTGRYLILMVDGARHLPVWRSCRRRCRRLLQLAWDGRFGGRCLVDGVELIPKGGARQAVRQPVAALLRQRPHPLRIEAQRGLTPLPRNNKAMPIHDDRRGG